MVSSAPEGRFCMTEQVQIVRVVVASPEDVQPERDCLPEVIDELNRGLAADRGLRLELISWQTDAYPGFHPEGSQAQIDSGLDIENSDVLIGVFWKRFGTPVKDAKSGTEHEFRKAYESWQKKKQPQIMMYFSEQPYTPKSKKELDQWSKVFRFKDKFPKEGLWWSYQAKGAFQKLVREHLTKFIRNKAPVGRVEAAAVWPPPPQRPGLFVGREEGLKELRRRLGIGRNNDAAQIQPITAVFGVGGVGKTTLAAALAYDDEVRRAFPDGILWTALGEQPTVLSALARWGDAFGKPGDKLAGAATLTAALDELTRLIKNKRMLLIVDDVWETNHAAMLKVARGPNCALIFTTRERQLASDLTDNPEEQVYNLPVLTDESGLALLRELAKSVVEKHRQKCLELVRALEGLPLALQVAGRMLHAEAEKQRGLLEKLLDELRTGKKLLKARAPADRMNYEKETIPTVAVLLKRSIDRLDKTSRVRFAQLGACPKPAIVDRKMLKYLWNVKDPGGTVDILVERGLLEPVGEDKYQIHALLVSLADSLLGD
jgi:hypothetical protein